MKKSKKFLINVIYWIAVVVMIGSAAYIGYTYYEFYISEQQIKKVQDIVQLPQETGDPAEDQSKINFDALEEINEDAKAWIRIDQTKVDYPILHGSNNEYYLNHNIFGKYDRQGSVFLDSNVQLGSQYMTLFAHNMKNGSMFADINKYKTAEFKEKHPIIRVFTRQKEYQYEVIAAFFYNTKQDTAEYILTNLHIEKLVQYRSFINERNLYDTFEIDENSSLLTLSTCNYDNKGDRFVLIAKLI